MYIDNNDEKKLPNIRDLHVLFEQKVEQFRCMTQSTGR